MASLWEQIQEKKKKVDELEAKRKQKRAEFLADDGEIDEEEELQLSKIRGGISVAKRKVEGMIKEFEKNQKIWQGHAGELAEIKKQLKDLAEWEDPVCKNIETALKGIDTCETDQNFKEATSQLKTALASIKGPYAEYKKQKPERDLFEKEKPDFEGRLSKLKTTKYQTDSFNNAIAGLDTGFPDVCMQADNKDFISARKGLASLMGTIEEEEEEIMMLTQKDNEAQELLKSVKDKFTSVGEAAYKTVQDAAKSVSEGMSEAEGNCSAFDFDTAIDKLKNVGSEVEKYAKKVAELAAEKAEWDAAQPDYETVKKGIKELQEWGEKAVDNVRKVADDALSKSDEEFWKDAASTVGTGLSEIGPMIEEMTKQKAAQSAYTGLRAAFDARLNMVRSSKYQTEIVTSVLAQIDTNLGAIKSHVDAKDFVEAVALLNIASSELMTAEAEIAKCALEETDAMALLEAVKNRVTSIGENTFEKLKDTAKAVTDGVSEAENTIDGLDYETAIRMLKELATEAEDYATRVRELVEEKAKWDGAQPIYEKVKEQIQELKDWGEKGVDAIKEVAEGAQTTADEEEWTDAKGKVDTCNMDIGPMVDEMTRQKAAQATYMGLRAAFDVRLTLVRQSKYQTELVVGVLGQIDTNLGAIDAHVEAKDFVEALALLNIASGELEKAETEILRLKQVEETAKAMLREMMNKVGTLPANAFRELVETTSEVMSKVVEIERQIAEMLFDQAISTMTGFANTVETLVRRSAELAAEKAEWEAVKPTYDAVKKQILELQDWGEKAVDNIRKVADDAFTNSEDEKWKDAADKTKTCNMDIGPMVDEMTKQKAAQAVYQGMRAALDARLTVVRQSKYQTEIVTAVLAQIDTNLPAIQAHVDAKDFQEALALVNAASEELKHAEDDIAKAMQDETDAMALLEAVKNRFASVGEHVFEQVKDTAKAISDGVDEAEQTIDGLDYETAMEKLKGLATEAENYATRIAELVREKAQWDGAQPMYEKVKEQIEELREWGEKGVDAIKEAAEGAQTTADEEKFADAAGAVDTCNMDIGPMVENMHAQKAAQGAYLGLRAIFDVRLKIVRTSAYQNDIVQAVLAQIDTNMDAIDAHVEANDFVEALALINAAIEELGHAEEEINKLAEQEKNFQDKFDKLTKDFMEIQNSEFKEEEAVKSMMEAFLEDHEASTGSADQHKYEDALNLLENCEQHHLPAVKEEIKKAADEQQKQQDAFQTKFDALTQEFMKHQDTKFKEKNDVKTLMDAFLEDHEASAGSADLKKFEDAMNLLENCEKHHLPGLIEAIAAFQEEEEAMQAFAEEEEEMMQAFKAIEEKVDEVLKELQTA